MKEILGKSKLQKKLAILLAFIMLFMCVPFAFTANAATIEQTGSNSITVTLTGENLQIRTSDGNEECSTDGTNWTSYSGGIIIKGNGSVTVLDGTHNIGLYDASLSGASAFDIKSGAAVNLSLLGDNSCKASSYDCAGLHVPEGAELTIAKSTGSLTAEGSGGGAGIGGGYNEASGRIIINGGTITAVGVYTGAGIGGGERGACDVTINGGTIDATGAHGAAIGSGDMCYDENAGTVVINGGTVTATSTSAAAAIGGGGSSQGYVTINGGIVTAINTHTDGYTGGAAIGGGDSYNGIGCVFINGGTVIAEAYKGDGIGGSSRSSGSTVEITGGNIKATSVQGEGISGLSYSGTELTEITLDKVAADAKITSIETDDGEYGIKDVYLIDGKLYAYLPSGTVIKSIEIDGVTYPIYSSKINYYVAPTYTVTIPKTVKLGETAEIKAENVILKKGESLNVTLSGTAENDKLAVKCGEASLSYQINNGSVTVGSKVLTVTPANNDINGASGSAELNFSKPTTEPFYSGSYTGTVTFTVSVE